MYTSSKQISSPMLLPLVGSILSTGIVASLFVSLPTRPSLTFGQLFLRAGMDIIITACIHLTTVWAIWRLTRDYLGAPIRLLMLHIWAAVVWVPLIALLSAESSLWLCCIVPWSCANAAVFLKLWTTSLADNPYEFQDRRCPAKPLLFHSEPVPQLWRTLLPYVVVALATQTGVALLAAGDSWKAAALFSTGVLILLLRDLLESPEQLFRQRRRFSRSSFVQTAVVFLLISLALTPFLRKAYGIQSWKPLLAMHTPELSSPRMQALQSGYSGVVLTLPPRPHPQIEPPLPRVKLSFSSAILKPVVIPFDGAYWYFKSPDTHPRPDARIQRGDPIKANVRSTDGSSLIMEAHQGLPNSMALNCCRGLRIELLNGDARPGIIRLEVNLRDTSAKNQRPVSLGRIVIPSSALNHISLTRAPVHESLRFALPHVAEGKRFNEITLVIAPDKDRSLAGSKIAIQQFTLLP